MNTHVIVMRVFLRMRGRKWVRTCLIVIALLVILFQFRYQKSKIFFAQNSYINLTYKADESLLYSSNLSEPYYGLSCSGIFNKTISPTQLSKAKKWMYPKAVKRTDKDFVREIEQDCNSFIRTRSYFLHLSNTSEEENFPIAFTIMAFKDAAQIERLFRMIYRPWNYYCFHVDLNADPVFYRAVDLLAKCFSNLHGNVINTNRRVKVKWGEYSVLESDLNCMEELYKSFKKWKYLINLTGQEFPLRTNLELVRIFKAYKGANNVDGVYVKRYEYRVPKIQVPFALSWFQGSVHIAVNRQFIQFIFENKKSAIMLHALRKTIIPDEEFFSTLNHNPILKIPGTYVGDPMEDFGEHPVRLRDYFITRFKNWGDWPCSTKIFVRHICILGVGDLPLLVRLPHLFANKFYENNEPATLVCLEKYYRIRVNEEETTGKVAIDIDYYGSMPFVKFQYNPNIDQF